MTEQDYDEDFEELLRFVGIPLLWRDLQIGDWDGADMQEAMEQHGIASRVVRTTPCREGCRCAEDVGTGEEVECFPYTELGMRAVVAYRAWQDVQADVRAALAIRAAGPTEETK